MKRKIALPFLSLLMAMSLLLASCAPQPAQPAAPTEAPGAANPPAAPTTGPAPTAAPTGGIKRGGELVFGRSEEPLTLDPMVPGDNGSIYDLVQIFDTVMRVGPTGNEVEPGLAESYDVSPDGKTYTFKLRDAKFSHGDPVTAADVVFSLERARSADSAGAFAFEMVDKISSPDPKTVVVTLTGPSAPFLSAMSYYVASVVPQKVFEADPQGFGTKPVGSGPFMIASYTRGEDIVLTPNPYYWEMGADGKPLPYLDKITIKYVPETSTRVLGLQNGDLDAIQDVPYNNAAAIGSMPGIKLDIGEIFGLKYLYLNTTYPPTDNVDFRLALNYATDRDAILKNVYFGYGTVPNSCFPRMAYWNKDQPKIPYDVAKAKEFLAKSGYTGQTIELLVSAGDSVAKGEAVMLQQMWNDAGITATIKEEDKGSLIDYLHKNNDWNTLVLETTSDINDDDELQTLKTGSGYWGSHYNNPAVTAALTAARESLDPKVRAENYATVQRITYAEDAMCVPFTYTPALAAYHDYVHNFKTLTTGWWWLRNVWVDKTQ